MTPPQATVTRDMHQDDSASRVAERLQRRIERRFERTVSLKTLRKAVEHRRALFSRTVTIFFQDENSGAQAATWTVSLGQYPEWVMFDVSSADFVIDEASVQHTMRTNGPDVLTPPSFATASGTRDDGKVLRVTIEGSVADGYTLDHEDAAKMVVDSLERGRQVTVVPVTFVEGSLLYDDGERTVALRELGTGRSVFNTSPWGRKQNVRKAMNEKANAVVIPEGTTFSFNATLGGPVTYGNGWYDSLIIVNGSKLEPAPGGGICQAATTVFRAAVAAGLPIDKRKSHSLYVTYYKQYGMGLDATVYPGRQDMTFRNDTPGPLILVGKTDEHDNAYSTLYGVDDERTVELEGPYFGYTHSEPVMGRTLRSSEVAWIQRVTNADGTTREDLLVAQYGKLPKSVALEYTPVMHGAADLVADSR